MICERAPCVFHGWRLTHRGTRTLADAQAPARRHHACALTRAHAGTHARGHAHTHRRTRGHARRTRAHARRTRAHGHALVRICFMPALGLSFLGGTLCWLFFLTGKPKGNGGRLKREPTHVWVQVRLFSQFSPLVAKNPVFDQGRRGNLSEDFG